MEEWLADILPRVVPYIECLSLFLYNIQDDVEELDVARWKFEIDKGNDISGESESLVIMYDINEIGFDFFGFVGKELDKKGSKNYGASLYLELVKNLSIFMEKYLWKKKIEFNQIKRFIGRMERNAKKNSIWFGSEFGKHTIGQEAVFPYYDLDMSYNVMKRVRRKLKEKTRVQEAPGK